MKVTISISTFLSIFGRTSARVPSCDVALLETASKHTYKYIHAFNEIERCSRTKKNTSFLSSAHLCVVKNHHQMLNCFQQPKSWVGDKKMTAKMKASSSFFFFFVFLFFFSFWNASVAPCFSQHTRTHTHVTIFNTRICLANNDASDDDLKEREESKRSKKKTKADLLLRAWEVYRKNSTFSLRHGKIGGGEQQMFMKKENTQ